MQCLGFLHKQDNCRFKPPKCKDSDGTTCGACHLMELHGCDHSTVLALDPRLSGIGEVLPPSAAHPVVQAAQLGLSWPHIGSHR